MTPTETVRLLGLVVQIAPAQKVDEYTADAWHLVLGYLDFGTAKDAVVEVARRKAFIAPADIVAEAHRLRAARREQESPMAVPDADPDDPRAYAAALRAGRMRLPVGLKRRPELGDTFRRVLTS